MPAVVDLVEHTGVHARGLDRGLKGLSNQISNAGMGRVAFDYNGTTSSKGGGCVTASRGKGEREV